jgi:hypothetical protein
VRYVRFDYQNQGDKKTMVASTSDTYLSGIISACESFKNEAIEEAIKSSTQASWGGSGYSVELFSNGSYRVLWNNQIGNLYESEGVIIGVPTCSDDESSDGDSTEWFFDNAIESFEEKFNQWKSDYLAHAQ